MTPPFELDDAAEVYTRMRKPARLVLLIVALTFGPSTGGTVQPVGIELPGATLDLQIAESIDDRNGAKIEQWIRDTASHLTLAYGRFPVPNPRVVVMHRGSSPWGGDSPVPFGRVTRSGGETVELYVDTKRPLADLEYDWTATHEFSHLLLPRISWRQKWISEGFASYYQNVLMARAARYTKKEALEKLEAGLKRGRASRPELSLNKAALEGVREARMKIYWGGAAIALLADVELRERSGNTESLDLVLDRFQRCCLPSQRRWSGTDLFTRFDSLIDGAVFMPLYREYANTAGFPDFETALHRDIVREEILAVRTSPH